MKNEIYQDLIQRYRNASVDNTHIISDAKSLSDKGESGATRFLCMYW